MQYDTVTWTQKVKENIKNIANNGNNTWRHEKQRINHLNPNKQTNENNRQFSSSGIKLSVRQFHLVYP